MGVLGRLSYTNVGEGPGGRRKGGRTPTQGVQHFRLEASPPRGKSWGGGIRRRGEEQSAFTNTEEFAETSFKFTALKRLHAEREGKLSRFLGAQFTSSPLKSHGKVNGIGKEVNYLRLMSTKTKLQAEH